jgi:hypothetical protein
MRMGFGAVDFGDDMISFFKIVFNKHQKVFDRN